jgi:hypothetical protein
VRLAGRRGSALCALGGALALGGCGAGAVTRTESGPPHVLSVTVPVSVPATGSNAPQAATATAPAVTGAPAPAAPATRHGPRGHDRRAQQDRGHGDGEQSGD